MVEALFGSKKAKAAAPAGPAAPAYDGPMPRKAPSVYIKKWEGWRLWQEFFAWLHLVIGSLSIICSSLVAANAAKTFLTPAAAIALATGTAVFAFVLAFVNAKQKNECFERAARELEKAIARYEGDASLGLEVLVDAQLRGIDILNQRDALQDPNGDKG